MKPYNSKKDKTELFLIIFLIILGVLFSGFGIWTVVEFLLYLVKDNPFNWWSLGLMITVFVFQLFFYIKFILSE